MRTSVVDEPTFEEIFQAARMGRTQSWIIKEMNNRGIDINDVKFSRKKNGHSAFSNKELDVLSEILEADFSPIKTENHE